MARPQQNTTIKEFEALDRALNELRTRVLPAVSRDTFSSGVYLQPKLTKSDPMFEKDSRTSYADTTGELAISQEQADIVYHYVKAISDNIHNALNAAKTVLAITPSDVAERARISTPDCSACGDPIVGKIFYGRWDNKCRVRFRRWVESGNASDEKMRFEIMVRDGRA